MKKQSKVLRKLASERKAQLRQLRRENAQKLAGFLFEKVIVYIKNVARQGEMNIRLSRQVFPELYDLDNYDVACYLRKLLKG